MDSKQPNSLPTTQILDLNDDCLAEVFQYLHLIDLAVIADVCSRFRGNALSHFVRTKHKDLILWKIMYQRYGRALPENKRLMLKSTAKILRNFGTFIRSMVLNDHNSKECIELLSTHCLEMLTDLNLCFVKITDDMAIDERPLFRNLRTLHLNGCEYPDLFLKMLPIWSPELRKLVLHSRGSSLRTKVSFDGLCQTFPKLVTVSFVYNHDLTYRDIEEFLKCNPQLKEIEIVDYFEVNACIIQSIAKYVPEIETIWFQNLCQTNQEIPKCLGNLYKLRSFKSAIGNVYDSSTFTSSAIYEICASEIPLEHLRLQNIDLNLTADQFIDNLSKLKSLRTLRLDYVRNLSTFHILALCKHLKGLTKLILNRCNDNSLPDLSGNNLLEFIQNAENLQEFWILNNCRHKKYRIDADTYNKMVEIVERRRDKLHLVLLLDEEVFMADKLPASFAREGKSVTVKICDYFKHMLNLQTYLG